jgi:dephospho-CoA kinase
VRARFDDLGVPTIDADVLAREAVAPGTPGLTAIVARFGPDVVDEQGALDRRKLATLAFADAAARHDLETIIHPVVRQRIDAWFDSLDARHPFAIADIPLLFETHREREFDAVIVTACDPATQITRVMARDSVSEDDARRRVAAQLPIDEKIRRADYVIDTNGTPTETEAQVRQVYRKILEQTTR